MMTPNDLKNKTFTQTFRGYAKNEVDEFLSSVAEQYTQLYQQYSQLSKNYNQLNEAYRSAQASLLEMKNNEDAIRRALVDSQNAAAQVVETAQKKGEEIENLILKKCEEILSSFRDKVRAERERLSLLRAQVNDFKARIYEQYQSHIETVENITAVVSQDDWDLTATEATKAVLIHLRGELERRTLHDEREEEQLDHEIDIIIDALIQGKKANKPEDGGKDT